MTAPGAGGTRRTTVVWLALCGLTIVSALIASTVGHGDHDVAIGLLVLGIGAVKARLVLQQFMDLRHAPRWLGAVTDLWLVVVVAFVAILHAA